MNVRVLLFTLALASPTVAAAQILMTTPIYPYYRWRDRHLKAIELSKTQKVQVDSIAKSYWQLLHRLDAKFKQVSRDSLRSWLDSIGEDQMDDIRSLLTPAQRRVFDNNRAAWKREKSP